MLGDGAKEGEGVGRRSGGWMGAGGVYTTLRSSQRHSRHIRIADP